VRGWRCGRRHRPVVPLGPAGLCLATVLGVPLLVAAWLAEGLHW